jgi:hypothetical protein
MLNKKKLSALMFAEKIDAILPQAKISINKTNFKYKALRIPSLEIYPSVHCLKKTNQFYAEELKERRIKLIAVAHQTIKCRERQNLHLFQIKKNYCQKNLPLKAVKDWKFPQKSLIEKTIISNTIQISDWSKDKKFLYITPILKAR